jgi:hypothetical protein
MKTATRRADRPARQAEPATDKRRTIADAIDFLARCRAIGLEMEAEYIEGYAQSVPEGCPLPAAHAWEASLLAIVGFTDQCETALMRMVLLACERTADMLGNKEDVDIESLKELGACSIRTEQFILTVGLESEDNDAHLAVATARNLVDVSREAL